MKTKEKFKVGGYYINNDNVGIHVTASIRMGRHRGWNVTDSTVDPQNMFIIHNNSRKEYIEVTKEEFYQQFPNFEDSKLLWIGVNDSSQFKKDNDH